MIQNNNNETSYKWLILISVCMNTLSNLFLYNAFAPIWTFVAVYYNTTDYQLNWFTNCFFIGPITLTFIFNPLILKYFGASQILGGTFSCLGLFVLVFAQRDYNLGLTGFILLGLGSSLSFHVPLYVSKLWFQPYEKIVSTFVGQYSSNLGLLIGYTTSSLYFNNNDEQEVFNKKFENLIIINAIFAAITLALSFSMLRKNKNSQDIVSARDAIWLSIYKICSNLESIFDLVSFASLIGYSWCYPVLFSAQQLALGQTFFEITTTTISFFFSQIFAAAFCTFQLQKQANQGLQLNYDKYIKHLICLGFTFLTIEIVFFDSLSFILLTITHFFIGAGFGGIYSILLESLMEKHYPVQELAIGSLVDAVASAFGLIITMILVIPKILEFGYFIYSFLVIPSFCYIVIFYETNFKRFEFEA